IHRVQARSIIPGRQRWDIGIVLASPHVAEFLDGRLRQAPGVESVRANPITGRLLVHHDMALTSQDVEQLVREAVELAARQVVEQVQLSRPTRTELAARVQPRYCGTSPLVLAGSATLVMAPCLSKLIWRSPLIRVGAILVATVVVVRRAWRRSIHTKQNSTTPSTVIRYPLLTIAGPHKNKLYLTSLFSVLSQLLDFVFIIFMGWIIVVPIVGKSTILVRLGLTSTAVQMWFLVGAATVTAIIDDVVTFRAAALWRNISQSVQHYWRTETYAHVQRVELRYLEGERATRLARVLTDDINQLGQFFATSAHNLVRLGSSFAVLVPAFLYFSPGSAWSVLVSVPIITWLSFFYQERMAADYAANAENGSLLNSQLINSL